MAGFMKGSDLRVVVQSTNLKELANFVAEKLATIDGVNGTVTHFLSLRRYKEDHVFYLEEAGDERLVIAP